MNNMYLKIYNWTKTFLAKALGILAALVLVMTFVDYLLKWQIYPYIFRTVSISSGVFYKFAFEIFVLVCLASLALLYWKIRKEVLSSKSNMLEKQIVDTKTLLEGQIKKVSDFVSLQTKGVESRLSEQIFDIKQTMIDFEIENYRTKGQVGEVSKMIEKLQMDVKRGWGAEDTLPEIKEYIKKSGMPNYFLDDLHKALKGVPDSLKRLGEETLKLAEEKLYKPK